MQTHPSPNPSPARGGERRPDPESPERTPCSPFPAGKGAGGAGPEIDHYTILGQNVGFRFPSAAVAGLFRHILSGFPAAASPPDTSLYDIEENPGTGTYRVTVDGEPLGVCHSTDSLVSQVEGALLQAVFQRMPCPGLHAGCVTRSGCTLLLPGRSGAGKTTLVLGLLLKGWTLLSDEVAPLRPDTSEALAFPRVLCVKNRTLGLFDSLDLEGILKRPGAALDVNGVACIAPGSFPVAPANRSFGVTAVVFPAYSAGGRTELNAISRARALSLLMRHILNRRAHAAQALDILARLVERAACFTLASGALQPALDLLTDIPNHADRTAHSKPRGAP